MVYDSSIINKIYQIFKNKNIRKVITIIALRNSFSSHFSRPRLTAYYVFSFGCMSTLEYVSGQWRHRCAHFRFYHRPVRARISRKLLSFACWQWRSQGWDWGDSSPHFFPVPIYILHTIPENRGILCIALAKLILGIQNLQNTKNFHAPWVRNCFFYW